MNDDLYQLFLDWLRRRDTRVTLRLEDGSVLAEGCRPRTLFEECDATYREVKRLNGHLCATSLLLLRKEHGPAVDEFLATL